MRNEEANRVAMKPGAACSVMLPTGEFVNATFNKWDADGLVAIVQRGPETLTVGRTNIRALHPAEPFAQCNMTIEHGHVLRVVVQVCPECGGNPCPMPCKTCSGLGRVEQPEITTPWHTATTLMAGNVVVAQHVDGVCEHGDRPYRCRLCPWPIDDSDELEPLSDAEVVPPLDPEADTCAGCGKPIDIKAAEALAFHHQSTYHGRCWGQLREAGELAPKVRK